MGGQPVSDADLGRGCRQGNNAAWRELVNRFTPQVFRLACRMLRNRTEAEDATQEAFMRIYRSIDSFDPTRPLAPWVSRITYNVCLRRLERDPAKRTRSDDPQVLEQRVEARYSSPEQQAGARESTVVLDGLINAMSAQDRALVLMRYREGMSDAELAEATGMPVNTVKTRIFRARSWLRRQMVSHLSGGRGGRA